MKLNFHIKVIVRFLCGIDILLYLEIKCENLLIFVKHFWDGFTKKHRRIPMAVICKKKRWEQVKTSSNSWKERWTWWHIYCQPCRRESCLSHHKQHTTGNEVHDPHSQMRNMRQPLFARTGQALLKEGTLHSLFEERRPNNRRGYNNHDRRHRHADYLGAVRVATPQTG